MIMVRKDIIWETIRDSDISENTDNIEIKGIRIKGKENILNLIGIYKKPGKDVNRKTWEEIVKTKKQDQKWIIMGNFNAHNREWNCRRTNEESETLLEVMGENGLYIVNVKTETWIGDSVRRPRNLDLAFASEEIVGEMKLNNWKTWGSNNYPVMYEMKFERGIYKKKGNRLSNKRTDWKTYRRELLIIEENTKEEEYKKMSNKQKYKWVCESMKPLKKQTDIKIKQMEGKRKQQGIKRRILNRGMGMK